MLANPIPGSGPSDMSMIPFVPESDSKSTVTQVKKDEFLLLADEIQELRSEKVELGDVKL
jgi:hypothetical protein